MIMCKTGKGTLNSWSCGNKYYNSSTDERGISIGMYGNGGGAFIHVQYNPNTDKMELEINHKELKRIGIEIVDWR